LSPELDRLRYLLAEESKLARESGKKAGKKAGKLTRRKAGK
jgi:hypothetical protein